MNTTVNFCKPKPPTFSLSLMANSPPSWESSWRFNQNNFSTQTCALWSAAGRYWTFAGTLHAIRQHRALCRAKPTVWNFTNVESPGVSYKGAKLQGTKKWPAIEEVLYRSRASSLTVDVNLSKAEIFVFRFVIFHFFEGNLEVEPFLCLEGFRRKHFCLRAQTQFTTICPSCENIVHH